jgi:hypothetical protein
MAARGAASTYEALSEKGGALIRLREDHRWRARSLASIELFQDDDAGFLEWLQGILEVH